MNRLLSGLVAIGLVCGACQEPAPRLNAPPHGTQEKAPELQAEYTHMLENALLEDMVVSDIHFVPHRAILNSLGEERLARLASLMELYGGTIHLSTYVTDPKLVEARVEQVRNYLCAAGIDTTAETVVPGLAQGRGMDAPQAILIKTNEGTYVPKKSGGGGDVDLMLAKPGK
jgi:hypothetical protein